MNTQKHKLKDLDLRDEGHHLLKAKGNEWPPRSTNAKTNTFGAKDIVFVRPKVTDGCLEAQVRRPGPSGKVINFGCEGGG